MVVVFVGTAIVEPSETLGFYHLHPRDRFWQLLEIGGITPEQIIHPKERKALTEGHAKGNLSDPIRSMFFQKKTSQLLKLEIGLTDLNRRVIASSDKDKSGRPTQEDIQEFSQKVERLNPKILAFVSDSEIFVELFRRELAGNLGILGLQPFRISKSEVWLLGSTTKMLRGEALTRQEDAFFELGERISALKGMSISSS